MTTRADDYHQRAEEAERKAIATKDPEAQRIYEDIARQWREMAAQADRLKW